MNERIELPNGWILTPFGLAENASRPPLSWSDVAATSEEVGPCTDGDYVATVYITKDNDIVEDHYEILIWRSEGTVLKYIVGM